MYIAVVGGQLCTEEEARAAYEVGRLLAERDAVVICGGLTGVMEAVCRGAKEAGGTTIGVLPGPFRSDANQYVDHAIATDMGQARNAIIVRTSDAVIAIGGEYGTLSEIAMALKMGKRVVAISTWDIANRGVSDDKIIRAETPETAVDIVEAGVR
ncbi:MAG: TIGR00725 family protein [Candidatus Solincola sediminis]|uniref:TIGR00725 family protein n=1 Tax=Candidatus Solincola sediminis TaxID=1797199 RepID=A0A1F2WR99_9ACTN|nr:MAG: TIGR00725 family protein [Candidatus Solincola sediminis]OFW60255.1 MAG: TIGR00725 family protein [Candidatus Solincola sediminis]